MTRVRRYVELAHVGYLCVCALVALRPTLSDVLTFCYFAWSTACESRRPVSGWSW